jgi:hypothetical protein
MKFNDITTIQTPAQAARRALRKESINVEQLGGRALREQLERVQQEIDTLASRGGADYTRAILQREVYEEMANVDSVLFEADLEDTEIEQAEVIIAARAMNKDFQGMIEDVADMLGSDMITLVDQIKARFGDAAGEQYAQTVKASLEGAINSLMETKNTLDAAITNLTSGGDMLPAVAPGDELGGDDNAPIFPSSSGPEEEPTGREMKSDIE